MGQGLSSGCSAGNKRQQAATNQVAANQAAANHPRLCRPAATLQLL